MNLRYTVPMLFLLYGLMMAPGGGVQAAPSPTDAGITTWVFEALLADPHVDASTIAIAVHDGIVSLNGSVWNLTAKRYAALEAEKIKGVRGVINQLQVEPSPRFDADIAQDVRQRLIDSESIVSYGLRTSVQDGVVTLDGTVTSYAESQQAALLAGEIRGVKGIINHLTVDFPTVRSDDVIQTDVAGAVRRDVYLTGLPITTTVQDSVVTLRGEVGTAYQKERAGEDVSRVWNVARVDNRLKVVPWDDPRTRQQMPVLSDAQINAAVRQELAADARLATADITPHVAEGEVTLLGTVPSFYQKRVAAQDVRDVVGVMAVTDNLMVRTARRADTDLRIDVRQQLDTDALLAPDTLAARVHNGIVTLTGNVNSSFERSHAEAVAARVRGIRNVVNHIVVNWSHWYADKTMQQRIKDFLATNGETQWVAPQIHVAVDGGTVTLTGKVNAWAERNAAGEVAREMEGVRRVDNQLVIHREGV